VKARIHSQVLSFSFPCASRYKVGNPTNYAGSGPVAVRNQIDAYSGLLVGLLMMLTYILVLVVISPWLLLEVAAMRGMVIFMRGNFHRVSLLVHANSPNPDRCRDQPAGHGRFSGPAPATHQWPAGCSRCQPSQPDG
jgi:hypothetical protein